MSEHRWRIVLFVLWVISFGAVMMSVPIEQAGWLPASGPVLFGTAILGVVSVALLIAFFRMGLRQQPEGGARR